MKKLFLVTFNGFHFDKYGARIYLLGAYSSREKAEEACDKAEFNMKCMDDEYVSEVNKPTIEEVDLDDTKDLYNDFLTFHTDAYLGGYEE